MFLIKSNLQNCSIQVLLIVHYVHKLTALNHKMSDTCMETNFMALYCKLYYNNCYYWVWCIFLRVNVVYSLLIRLPSVIIAETPHRCVL